MQILKGAFEVNDEPWVFVAAAECTTCNGEATSLNNINLIERKNKQNKNSSHRQ